MNKPVKVKVFPGSKKPGVIKKSKDSFEVKVKAKPVMGKANKEVVKLLACYLGLPESKIRFIRGSRRRNKIFEIIE